MTALEDQAPGGPGGPRRALPHRPHAWDQTVARSPPPDPASQAWPVPCRVRGPPAAAAAVVAIVVAATAVTALTGSRSRPGPHSPGAATASSGQAPPKRPGKDNLPSTTSPQ